MFLNNGASQLVHAFSGGGSINITHIAIGDTSTILSPNDQTLMKEAFRKPVTKIYSYGTSIFIEAFIDLNEANFNWKQVGLYASGTSTKDSGTLIAETLVDESKDAKRTVNLVWEIKISIS